MYLTTEKPKRAGLSFNHYEHEKNNTKHTLVRLYDTAIVIADENKIKLNSEGFKTNHTKNCMNDFLPQGYEVFQKADNWYVQTPNDILEFKDNMILTV